MKSHNIFLFFLNQYVTCVPVQGLTTVSTMNQIHWKVKRITEKNPRWMNWAPSIFLTLLEQYSPKTVKFSHSAYLAEELKLKECEKIDSKVGYINKVQFRSCCASTEYKNYFRSTNDCTTHIKYQTISVWECTEALNIVELLEINEI